MEQEPITYTLTEDDRRELRASFGVELSDVPTQVTGGELNATRNGVLFQEAIGGHRIAFFLAGRPALARAASGALAHADEHVDRRVASASAA